MNRLNLKIIKLKCGLIRNVWNFRRLLRNFRRLWKFHRNLWNFRKFYWFLQNYEFTTRCVWKSNLWILSLPWGILKYFQPSPAARKHYKDRSGLNPNFEHKQQYELEMNKSKHTRDKGFVPEVRAHHQDIPTSPLRSPQRVGSLSTLILSQTDHKVKDGLLTQWAQWAGNTNFPEHPHEPSASTGDAYPSRSLKLQE